VQLDLVPENSFGDDWETMNVPKDGNISVLKRRAGADLEDQGLSCSSQLSSAMTASCLVFPVWKNEVLAVTI
jgi:hypothetical protein